VRADDQIADKKDPRLKTAKLIAALVCIIATVATFPGNASAQERALSKYSHVRIGGALSYPPHVFTHQVWFRDIVYDKSAKDTQYTSLDVYVADPLEAGSPVMVWVHGGGFRMGDKASSKDLASKPEYFTSKLGYILVSVNYRLIPEGQYPTNTQDVADAVAWVHNNIADFGGDPNQIFLMGHSAGAQLVAQVATDDKFLKKAGTDLRILKAVIANEGGYGVVAPGADTKALTATYGPDWRTAVAIGHVKAGKNIPPFLLLNVAGGSNAVADSEQQALGFAAALRAAGVRVDVVALDHVEHFGANERIGVPGDITTVSVERFLASIPGKKRAAKWTPGTLPKF
jgi:acetyl esterase/lipase